MTHAVKVGRLVEFVRQHGHACWETEDGRIAIETMAVSSEGAEFTRVTYSEPTWSDVRFALGY